MGRLLALLEWLLDDGEGHHLEAASRAVCWSLRSGKQGNFAGCGGSIRSVARRMERQVGGPGVDVPDLINPNV